MMLRLFLLIPLLGITLACEPAALPEASETAGADEVVDELKEPRKPEELFPLLLETRDGMRAIMGNSDIWYEDLAELQRLCDQMIALLVEVNEYARTQEPEGVDVVGVARSAADVEVAMALIFNGLDFEEPAMWRKTGPGVDQGLRGLERRFPEGVIKESIADRPDYAKHYLDVGK